MSSEWLLGTEYWGLETGEWVLSGLMYVIIIRVFS